MKIPKMVKFLKKKNEKIVERIIKLNNNSIIKLNNNACKILNKSSSKTIRLWKTLWLLFCEVCFLSGKNRS